MERNGPARGRPPATAAVAARRWLVGGRVQGVGYRPFVYRLAHRLGVRGWVRNLPAGVEVFAQGPPGALDALGAALTREAPPLAEARLMAVASPTLQDLDTFAILDSDGSDPGAVHLPADYFACDQCLAELYDPRNRRHRYPFINCTQCGPRYTLIDRLPYDRPNTAMAAFAMCPACRSEYLDPLDRRFHAQPVACPACGPRLTFCSADGRAVHGDDALRACCDALRHGLTVAVKGIGGYHLLCDATREEAVARLRDRKRRPHRPLAVMLPWRGGDGLAWVRRVAAPDGRAAALLRTPLRPIVLCTKRPDSPLAAAVAPGLNDVGVMLPYSPLHHLLLHDVDRPLVATSANLGGEPVITDDRDAVARLAALADAFLHHDRPIRRPADDSVMRSIAGRPRPLRLGRGAAPLELTLPTPISRPTLAVGAQMKSTVALAWDRRVVISPHIGDLGSTRSLQLFYQIINELEEIYNVQIEHIVCDAHPGYHATRWARRQATDVTAVPHHHAHASALLGEHPVMVPALVFCWDGTGLGTDGTLWGGEALLGRPGRWRRMASWRPFPLPGGERAIRQPWRTALSLCWTGGVPGFDDHQRGGLMHQAWQRGLNCPPTSAVGRLFDAAAALCGLLREASYDGQAPMLLEAACDAGVGEAIGLPLVRDAAGLWRSDWSPLLPMLLDSRRPVGRRAAGFHRSLAVALVDQALAVAAEHSVRCVGLSGGVFQNAILTAQAVELLEAKGFDVILSTQVPTNDAGISFGQIVDAAGRDSRPA